MSGAIIDLEELLISSAKDKILFSGLVFFIHSVKVVDESFLKKLIEKYGGIVNRSFEKNENYVVEDELTKENEDNVVLLFLKLFIILN
jgi:hypothetical protein